MHITREYFNNFFKKKKKKKKEEKKKNQYRYVYTGHQSSHVYKAKRLNAECANV